MALPTLTIQGVDPKVVREANRELAIMTNIELPKLRQTMKMMGGAFGRLGTQLRSRAEETLFLAQLSPDESIRQLSISMEEALMANLSLIERSALRTRLALRVELTSMNARDASNQQKLDREKKLAEIEKQLRQARNDGNQQYIKHLTEERSKIFESVTISERSQETFKRLLENFSTAVTDEEREMLQVRIQGQMNADKKSLELLEKRRNEEMLSIQRAQTDEQNMRLSSSKATQDEIARKRLEIQTRQQSISVFDNEIQTLRTGLSEREQIVNKTVDQYKKGMGGFASEAVSKSFKGGLIGALRGEGFGDLIGNVFKMSLDRSGVLTKKLPKMLGGASVGAFLFGAESEEGRKGAAQATAEVTGLRDTISVITRETLRQQGVVSGQTPLPQPQQIVYYPYQGSPPAPPVPGQMQGPGPIPPQAQQVQQVQQTGAKKLNVDKINVAGNITTPKIVVTGQQPAQQQTPPAQVTGQQTPPAPITTLETGYTPQSGYAVMPSEMAQKAVQMNVVSSQMEQVVRKELNDLIDAAVSDAESTGQTSSEYTAPSGMKYVFEIQAPMGGESRSSVKSVTIDATNVQMAQSSSTNVQTVPQATPSLVQTQQAATGLPPTTATLVPPEEGGAAAAAIVSAGVPPVPSAVAETTSQNIAQVAEGIIALSDAGTQPGSIYTHDIKLEVAIEGLKVIVQGLKDGMGVVKEGMQQSVTTIEKLGNVSEENLTKISESTTEETEITKEEQKKDDTQRKKQTKIEKLWNQILAPIKNIGKTISTSMSITKSIFSGTKKAFGVARDFLRSSNKDKMQMLRSGAANARERLSNLGKSIFAGDDEETTTPAARGGGGVVPRSAGGGVAPSAPGTASGAVAGKFGGSAGKGVGGFLQAIAKGVASFGNTKVLKGALSMFLIGTALLSLATAVLLFAQAGLKGILMTVAGLALLLGAMVILGKMQGQVYQGVGAMVAIGVALALVALGLSMAEGVSLTTIVGIVAAMTLLGALAVGLGVFAPLAYAGASALVAIGAAIALAGVGLLIGGAGILLMAMAIEKLAAIPAADLAKTIGMLGLAVLGMIAIFVALAFASPLIGVGVGTMFIAAGGILVLAGALYLLSAIDMESIGRGMLMFGLGFLALTAALILFIPITAISPLIALGMWVISIGIGYINESLQGFPIAEAYALTDVLSKIGQISDGLNKTAGALFSIAGALVVFGAAVLISTGLLMVAAIASAIGSFFGLGKTNILDIIFGLAAEGDRLMKVAQALMMIATALSMIGNALVTLGEIDPDVAIETLATITDMDETEIQKLQAVSGAMESANAQNEQLKTEQQAAMIEKGFNGSQGAPAQMLAMQNILGRSTSFMFPNTGGRNNDPSILFSRERYYSMIYR